MNVQEIARTVREAHNLTEKRIWNGELPRLSKSYIPCVDCGKRAEHYDHRDYGNPELVEPVCRSCNGKRGAAVMRQSIRKVRPRYECSVCGNQWHPRVAWPKKCPNPKCQSIEWASANPGRPRKQED